MYIERHFIAIADQIHTSPVCKWAEMSLEIREFQLGSLILLSWSRNISADWHRKTGHGIDLYSKLLSQIPGEQWQWPKVFLASLALEQCAWREMMINFSKGGWKLEKERRWLVLWTYHWKLERPNQAWKWNCCFTEKHFCCDTIWVTIMRLANFLVLLKLPMFPFCKWRWIFCLISLLFPS